jgi:putative ABC transport system permease protein
LRAALQHPRIDGLLTAGLTQGLAAQALGIALLLGLAGGLMPALRASGMSPTQALRHE